MTANIIPIAVSVSCTKTPTDTVRCVKWIHWAAITVDGWVPLNRTIALTKKTSYGARKNCLLKRK